MMLTTKTQNIGIFILKSVKICLKSQNILKSANLWKKFRNSHFSRRGENISSYWCFLPDRISSMISTPQKAFMMPFAPELEKSKWFSFSNRPISPRLFFVCPNSPQNLWVIWILPRSSGKRPRKVFSSFLYFISAFVFEIVPWYGVSSLPHHQQKTYFHKLFA